MPDLVLFLLLAVALPAYSAHELRQLRRARAWDARERRAGYLWTLAILWGLTGFLVVLWIVSERPWAALGLVGAQGSNAGPLRFFVALALALVVSIAYAFQMAVAMRHTESHEELRSAMGTTYKMLPKTRGELRLFDAVSVTAGITEELLYRGFMLWLLQPHLGLIGGAAVAVLLFGAAHAYQGVAGVVRSTATGGVLMGLYLLGGALWGPIVLHAAIDLVGGRCGYRLQQTESAPTAAEAASAAQML